MDKFPIYMAILWHVFILILSVVGHYDFGTALRLQFYVAFFVHAGYLIWNLPAGAKAISQAMKAQKEELKKAKK
jgi:hypothetical protein